MWPSLIMLIVFSAVCILVVGYFVLFFTDNTVGERIRGCYFEGQRIVRMIESGTGEGKSISEAVDACRLADRKLPDIYITDSQLLYVYGTGESKPVLSEETELIFGGQYTLYMDDSWEYGTEGSVTDVLSVTFEEILSATFDNMRKGMLKDYFFPSLAPGGSNAVHSEWLDESIISERLWIEIPYGDGEYRLFVNSSLDIRRQDTFYILLIGIVAVIVLMIPILMWFIMTVSNVATQRRVRKMLYTDSVTDGHNWLYFKTYATKLVRRLINRKKVYATVCLQLENYQNYCSCMGVRRGEELLECMDGFLQSRIDINEVYGHYGNADFALMLRLEGNNREEWQRYCTKRLSSLLAELSGLKAEQRLHFHAGVCFIEPYVREGRKIWPGRRNVDIDQLFNNADSACKTTHSDESQQIFFYSEEVFKGQNWENKVEALMDTALANGEFEVYLQPKYTPGDNRLVGAEALVRWNSPDAGMISPGTFIPIFEKNGFIIRLDDYMVREISKLQAEWRIQGRKNIPISVNISKAHFTAEGFAEHICKLVDGYGAKHNLIELELTEGAFLEDKESLINTVSQLRAYGFTVSMDDFGAGYSSLNSLRKLPLDVLKLDKDFMDEDVYNQRANTIIRQIIALAKELDMKVVAEGVEYREQVDFLISAGCDMIQGYYYARPMPVSEFVELVEKDA